MDRQRLRYWVGKAYMGFFGWEVEGQVPDAPRYVVIAAPHTTNWDLPFMLGTAYVLGFDPSWIGKHTLFKGVKGHFYRWLGGIPVDRSAKKDQVQQIVEHIQSVDRIALAIAPEGSRSKQRYWKSGFYHIALGAQVPIALGYLDYQRKCGGLGPSFVPSGDLDADVARIRDFYAGIAGKYPENFSNIAFRPEGEGKERPPRRGRVSAFLHGLGWLKA